MLKAITYASLILFGNLALATQATAVDVLLYAANPEAPTPPENWLLYQNVSKKLGVDLKFDMVTSASEDKLLTAIKNNNLPDLFEVRDYQLFAELARGGKIGAVDGLLPVMPRRSQQRYGNSKRADLVRVDGKTYGLQERSTLNRQYGVWIRQDWLNALDLNMPTTIDEFLAVAKAFTERDPDGNGKKDTYGYGAVLDYEPNGMLPGLGLGNQFQWVYGAYGVAGTWNYSKNFKANIKDANYRKATETIQKMNAYMDPKWPTMKRAEMRSRWQQGEYGMFFDSVGGLQSGMLRMYNNNPSAALALVPPIKGPKGKTSLGTYSSAGALFVVSKKALQDPEKSAAIARLLEWGNSDEGYLAVAWGQKGVDYVYTKSAVAAVPTANPAADPLERGSRVQMRSLALDGGRKELKGRYPILTLPNGKRYAMHTYVQKTQRQGRWLDRTSDLLVKPANNQTDIEKYASSSLLELVASDKAVSDDAWSKFIKGLDDLNFDAYQASAKNTLKAAGYLR